MSENTILLNCFVKLFPYNLTFCAIRNKLENCRDAIKVLNCHINLKTTVTNLPLQLKIKQ